MSFPVWKRLSAPSADLSARLTWPFAKSDLWGRPPSGTFVWLCPFSWLWPSSLLSLLWFTLFWNQRNKTLPRQLQRILFPPLSHIVIRATSDRPCFLALHQSGVLLWVSRLFQLVFFFFFFWWQASLSFFGESYWITVKCDSRKLLSYPKRSKKDHLKPPLPIGWELSLKGILFRSSVS